MHRLWLLDTQPKDIPHFLLQSHRYYSASAHLSLFVQDLCLFHCATTFHMFHNGEYQWLGAFTTNG